MRHSVLRQDMVLYRTSRQTDGAGGYTEQEGAAVYVRGVVMPERRFDNPVALRLEGVQLYRIYLDGRVDVSQGDVVEMDGRRYRVEQVIIIPTTPRTYTELTAWELRDGA